MAKFRVPNRGGISSISLAFVSRNFERHEHGSNSSPRWNIALRNPCKSCSWNAKNYWQSLRAVSERLDQMEEIECRMQNVQCSTINGHWYIDHSTLDIRQRSWRRPTLPRPRS